MGLFSPARNATTTDIGLLLIRCIVGVVFIYHGGQKLFPDVFGGHGMEGFTESVAKLNLPLLSHEVQAQLAAWAEFGGGILLILGLLTRLAAIPALVNMIVAVTMVHWGKFSIAEGGIEYALLLGILLLGLIFTGAGRFSLDGVIFGRCCRRKPTTPEEQA